MGLLRRAFPERSFSGSLGFFLCHRFGADDALEEGAMHICRLAGSWFLRTLNALSRFSFPTGIPPAVGHAEGENRKAEVDRSSSCRNSDCLVVLILVFGYVKRILALGDSF